jgi:hypothetical protein
MNSNRHSGKFEERIQNQEKDPGQARMTFVALRYVLRTQPCPRCMTPMGDMPGSRDAYCPNCGYKDPCCE